MKTMSCSRAYPLILDRMDAPLSPAKAEVLDQHLAQCDACSRLSEELGDLHALAEEETSFDDPSPEWEKELLSRWKVLRKDEEAQPQPWRVRSPWAILLTCTLLLLISLPMAALSPNSLQQSSLAAFAFLDEGSDQLIDLSQNWLPNDPVLSPMVGDAVLHGLKEVQVPMGFSNWTDELPPLPSLELSLIILLLALTFDIALTRLTTPTGSERIRS